MYSIVVVPPQTEPPCREAQFRLVPVSGSPSVRAVGRYTCVVSGRLREPAELPGNRWVLIATGYVTSAERVNMSHRGPRSAGPSRHGWSTTSRSTPARRPVTLADLRYRRAAAAGTVTPLHRLGGRKSPFPHRNVLEGHAELRLRPPVHDGQRHELRLLQVSALDVHNWTGDGPFINHQTPGTVAKFYNKDGIRWTSRAYESGRATWDPIWSLQPCGASLTS